MVVAALLAVLPGPAMAHLPADNSLPGAPCISHYTYGGDSSCKGHWEYSKMTFKWGGLIDDSDHAGHRTSFTRGADSWQYATNPTVPWYDSYLASSPTVVDLRNTGTSGVLGRALVAQPNGEFHFPLMLEIWTKHDIENIMCTPTQACSWYIGTSTTVATGQVDAWSVWTHEVGHAQNISHQSIDTHTGHDHTMRNAQFQANTDKRNSTYGIRQHEKVHACKPYELSHNDITCGSL